MYHYQTHCPVLLFDNIEQIVLWPSDHDCRLARMLEPSWRNQHYRSIFY